MSSSGSICGSRYRDHYPLGRKWLSGRVTSFKERDQCAMLVCMAASPQGRAEPRRSARPGSHATASLPAAGGRGADRGWRAEHATCGEPSLSRSGRLFLHVVSRLILDQNQHRPATGGPVTTIERQPTYSIECLSAYARKVIEVNALSKVIRLKGLRDYLKSPRKSVSWPGILMRTKFHSRVRTGKIARPTGGQRLLVVAAAGIAIALQSLFPRSHPIRIWSPVWRV